MGNPRLGFLHPGGLAILFEEHRRIAHAAHEHGRIRLVWADGYALSKWVAPHMRNVFTVSQTKSEPP